MTLTFRDKIILLVLAFGVCVYGGYKSLWIANAEKITTLEQHKQSIENLAGDLEPLKEEKIRLEKAEKEAKDSVNNIKNLSGGLTATNEEFLVFLGNSAKENNVAVSGFNELGTEVKGGIYRTVFDFELKGSSVDINKVLEDINNMGIKCSFGSVSYRQNEGFDYLKRFFDDISELPWYKEKEDDDKNNKSEREDEKLKPEITEKPSFDSGIEKPPLNLPEYIPDNPPEVINPPAQEDKPKTIEERLNELLTQTHVSSIKPYKVVFLTNVNSEKKTEFKLGQQMKLNVTVCLVMYNEPSIENSFLNKTESDSDEIL